MISGLLVYLVLENRKLVRYLLKRSGVLYGEGGLIREYLQPSKIVIGKVFAVFLVYNFYDTYALFLDAHGHGEKGLGWETDLFPYFGVMS